MDIHEMIAELETFYGEVYIDLGAAEKLPTDEMKEGGGFHPVLRRVLNLSQIREFLKTNLKKTRSYDSKGSRAVVYKFDSKRVPMARHSPGGNQRDLWHGCNFGEFLSIAADGFEFRHTTNEGCLLGSNGTYVGTFSKAYAYIGGIGNIYLQNGSRSMYGTGVSRLINGVMFKVRADLGRIMVAENERGLYQVVDAERDTLCAYRGSTVGGRTWNTSGLRASEWIVKKEQLAVTEVHFLYNSEAIKQQRNTNRIASSRVVVNPRFGD